MCITEQMYERVHNAHACIVSVASAALQLGK